jgi:glycosyltransferase involved in cell wall biosynthesis
MDTPLNSVRIWPTKLSEARADHLERYKLACGLIPKGSTVLDAACGVGYGTKMLHDAGLHVTGYDISPQAISWAETYFSQQNRPTFICRDLLSLSAHADFLVCFETLEHLEDPLKFLKNVTATFILASVPNEELYPYDPAIFVSDEFPHQRHYTPEQLEKLLNEAGYEVKGRFSQKDKQGKIEIGTAGRFIIFFAQSSCSIQSQQNRATPSTPPASPTPDDAPTPLSSICFYVAESNKGYILDRMAKEIAKVYQDPVFHYTNSTFPKASIYFATHYSLLPFLLSEVNPNHSKVACLFTHDKGHLELYSKYLNLCSKVIAESKEGMDVLVRYGVNPDILSYVPECADPNQFTPRPRHSDGAILVCGKNYSDGRKNPDLIAAVLSQLKHRTFIFLGENWEITKPFPNAISISEIYPKYPAIYHLCSVYLSCSKLEGGGPNSLIEAMHANLVPVASNTGNAVDYISHGVNGYIFPHDATAEQVCELIENAFSLDVPKLTGGLDVTQTVSAFTWPSYAATIKAMLAQ